MHRHTRRLWLALAALMLLAGLGSRCAEGGRQRVILQLRDGLEVSLSGRSFAIPGADPVAVTDLDRLLAERPVVSVERMFPDAEPDVEPGAKGDPRLLFAISVNADASDAEVATLLERLAANPLVERAYEEPIPELAKPTQ